MDISTLSKMVSSSPYALNSLWHYSIISVESNKVTIGNIIFAVLFFVLGLRYYRKLKIKLKDYLSRTLKDDQDLAVLLVNIISYGSLTIFVTIILQIANIPLSTFAFIGSALAIGVGLGAQNLISNFISSLIILIEKQVKIGDMITIDGHTGKVRAISARCITIETSKCSEVLIPNSKLVQDTLINYSLSNSLTKVTVDIKFYKNILCKIAHRHPDIYHNENEINKLMGKTKKHNIQEVIDKFNSIMRDFPQLNNDNDEDENEKIVFIGTDASFYKYQIVLKFDNKEINHFSIYKTKICQALSKEFDLDDMVIDFIS